MTTEITPQTTDGSTARNDAGRYTSDATFHATLDAIQRIAEHAAAEANIEPHRVGRNRFNASRRALGLTGECASAQGLVKAHNRPLSVLITAALGDREAAGRIVGQQAATWTQTPESLPNDAVLWGLKAATFAMGRPPTCTEYDEWMRAWARTRQAKGAFEIPAPVSGTLMSRFGDWSEVLEAAGAVTSAAANRQLTRRRSTAAPCHEILDRCIDDIGCLPVRRYFEEWARRRGIPVGRDLKPWGQVVEKCRRLRKEAGKWTPATATPEQSAPALPQQVGEDENQRRRSGGSKGVFWTEERILEALDEHYRAHLSGVARPTETHYRTVARGNRALPSSVTVQKAFGTMQAAFRRAGL